MLIANFARIMNNDGEYKKLLLSNGLAAAAIFGVSWLFFSRYAVGTLSMAVTVCTLGIYCTHCSFNNPLLPGLLTLAIASA